MSEPYVRALGRSPLVRSLRNKSAASLHLSACSSAMNKEL